MLTTFERCQTGMAKVLSHAANSFISFKVYFVVVNHLKYMDFAGIMLYQLF